MTIGASPRCCAECLFSYSLICRAPLRLRTGVLLYGPPGCGKTHAVAAALAATGMRYVSVKGPELLNKYIGASEAAVRDVFRCVPSISLLVFMLSARHAVCRSHVTCESRDNIVTHVPHPLRFRIPDRLCYLMLQTGGSSGAVCAIL